MLFFSHRLTQSGSFFKTLVDHEVTVELKNDISIKGMLKSVDQFLNIKLDDIQVVEELKYPHLVGAELDRQERQTRLLKERASGILKKLGS
ncbi:U6 snRNA-associated Sm-like protein LSm2 [Lecanora helva]